MSFGLVSLCAWGIKILHSCKKAVFVMPLTVFLCCMWGNLKTLPSAQTYPCHSVGFPLSVNLMHASFLNHFVLESETALCLKSSFQLLYFLLFALWHVLCLTGFTHSCGRSWYILCQCARWWNLFKLLLNYYVCSRGEKKGKFHMEKERNMVDGCIRNSIRLTTLL